MKILGLVITYFMFIIIFLSSLRTARALYGKKLKPCCHICKFHDYKLEFCLMERHQIEDSFETSCPYMKINDKLLRRGGKNKNCK